MCLAIPAPVTELLPDEMARVSLDGVVQDHFGRAGRGCRRSATTSSSMSAMRWPGSIRTKPSARWRCWPRRGTAARRPAHEICRRIPRRRARPPIAAAHRRARSSRDRTYRFMEFCGGHTHAISRYGIEDLLPANVRMIHGPGCPVCVLPIGRIDEAIALAQRAGRHAVHLWRPDARAGLERHVSLMQGQGRGRRHPHGLFDARRGAHRRGGAGPRGGVLRHRLRDHHAADRGGDPAGRSRRGSSNFTVFCNHVLTPVGDPGHPREPRRCASRPVRIDGFIGPAHVSHHHRHRALRRSSPRNSRKPVVIAGFEPLDVMQAILMLVRQVNEGRARGREPVHPRGHPRRQRNARKAVVAEVFELREELRMARPRRACPTARCGCSEKYAAVRRRAALRHRRRCRRADNPACECGAILRGVKKPAECKLFGTVCTPETPMGSCMVSSEGACAAHWTYGRFRDHARQEQVRVMSAAEGLSAQARHQARPRRHVATAPAAGRWRS